MLKEIIKIILTEISGSHLRRPDGGGEGPLVLGEDILGAVGGDDSGEHFRFFFDEKKNVEKFLTLTATAKWNVSCTIKTWLGEIQNLRNR